MKKFQLSNEINISYAIMNWQRNDIFILLNVDTDKRIFILRMVDSDMSGGHRTPRFVFLLLSYTAHYHGTLTVTRPTPFSLYHVIRFAYYLFATSMYIQYGSRKLYYLVPFCGFNIFLSYLKETCTDDLGTLVFSMSFKSCICFV